MQQFSLAPNHPVLNYPNKITSTDFEGWTQEQGLYYPNEFDKAFTLFCRHMTKEKVQNGALLIASYGKGYYIYTGLSLFRELPEGVWCISNISEYNFVKRTNKDTFPKKKTITQVIWKQKNKKLEKTILGFWSPMPFTFF
jgi:hypothetical protein